MSDRTVIRSGLFTTLASAVPLSGVSIDATVPPVFAGDPLLVYAFVKIRCTRYPAGPLPRSPRAPAFASSRRATNGRRREVRVSASARPMVPGRKSSHSACVTD